MATDVLVFVEDPGAANFAAALRPALAAEGLSVVVCAAGDAAPYLASGETIVQNVDGMTAQMVLQRFEPQLILVGTAENPANPALQLTTEARRNAISTIGMIDGPANVAHRFRGTTDDPLAFAPNRLFVPDRQTRDAYIAVGWDRGAVHVTGHPHFDRVRQVQAALAQEGRQSVRRRAYRHVPEDRPIVLFAAELSDGLDRAQYRRNEDYTLRGRGSNDLRTNIVLEEVLDAVSLCNPRPWFVVRLHPKNTADEFTPYANEIDQWSTGASALEAAFAADVVVGLTTVLLAEAVVLGRPTLSVLPRASEQGWLSTIAHGLTPAVTTRAALQTTLSGLLSSDFAPDIDRQHEAMPPGAARRAASIAAQAVSSAGTRAA